MKKNTFVIAYVDENGVVTGNLHHLHDGEYAYRKVAERHALKINDRRGKHVVSVFQKDDFEKQIAGKTRMVKSLMSGEMVEIPINTPYYLDPSHETYWSM